MTAAPKHLVINLENGSWYLTDSVSCTVADEARVHAAIRDMDAFTAWINAGPRFGVVMPKKEESK